MSPRRTVGSGTIPAFINPDGGSAKVAREVLEGHPAFEVRLTRPEELAEAMRRAVEAGTPRVLVAGGDGTLNSAAGVLAGTSTAMAVLPGGTLNHFARDHGIPSDPEEALRLAEHGGVTRVDVGYVNDRIFLNTSSVGAYVRFVETRDRLETRFGYWLASFIAGLRILRGLHRLEVALEAEGEKRTYRSPLVFIAVGERTLAPAGLGRPRHDAGGVLHVVIPRGRRQSRRYARAYARFESGRAVEAKPLAVDSALVQHLRLALKRKWLKIAVDGEIVRMTAPLEYRLGRGVLGLVAPPPEEEVTLNAVKGT